MRYLFTFIWSFLLAQMLTYVVSSMNGNSFSLGTGFILSIIFTVLVFVLGAIIPNEPNHKESAH
ncbi:YjzD family protein [Niallia nealsonii]|uniref:DUF2929 domain-containing protein n=1 Tax=Niallia nealsonii TaxID=115979 RepID=A0A2N0Z7N7_9BACI|nr:YjzD family protein [Niallia nealsonii]PKG25522.1 DUF2929 domain-containing protein [Niallia nealsonii]